MTAPIPWLEAFAAQRGLRYEAEADERWLRAWEPYATLKVPHRYEHALHATGEAGSITIARAVVASPHPPPPPAPPLELGTWIAIVQDTRLSRRVAVTSDFGGVFSEPLELAAMTRRSTGDGSFDHVFATFAETDDDVTRGLSPSLRRLLLSWRAPAHLELRPGGFVLAPVSATADARGLAWVFDAVHLVGAKAQKLSI